MNFFEAQDAARRNSLFLVILFCFAVLSLIGITNIIVMLVIAYEKSGAFPSTYEVFVAEFSWKLFIGIAIVISSIVALGSLYKAILLASGGRAVAESLGGRIVPQNSQDPMHRRLLNVVEEMAIASGAPVPSVYLLDENAINAFAAGWAPSNAVIGVTRGAATYLTRDELQGVIAHEFSHIYNGDMRLNIRLVSILHGILLLGMLGYYLMRSLRYIGNSQNKEGGSLVLAIFILGFSLAIIGYCGTFFGNWIKAIVSRQREYLADASAVQFTRNPDSIAGALKKIGGWSASSYLISPSAPEYSHAYFSPGISNFLFATHPPLKKRILRIEPRWDGNFIIPKRDLPPEKKPDKDKALRKDAVLKSIGAISASTTVNEAFLAIDRIGQANEREIAMASDMLASLPDTLRQEADNPFGVRALIYCLLIDRNKEIQAKQWVNLENNADPAVYTKSKQIYPLVALLEPGQRLPLIELCFPAIKTLSPSQYLTFKKNINALIAADKKLDLKEWVIQRIFQYQIDEAFGLRKPAKAKYSHIGAIKRELELILSMVAYTEHKDEQEAATAFLASIRTTGLTALKMIERKDITLTDLNLAMDKLSMVRPLLKPKILKILAACIASDEKITATGLEILRAVASCLDSPMPILMESK